MQAPFLPTAGLGLLQLSDVYGRAVSQLAVAASMGLEAVVNALTAAFGVPSGSVQEWLSGVMAEFSVWVNAFEQYLHLPLDFACYVEIDNRNGTSDLVLKSASASQGSYVVSPPNWIARGEIGRFVLQDHKPSIHGSEGSAEYAYCDAKLVAKTVKLTYECPTGIYPNKASVNQAEWQLFAKSGSAQSPWQSSVPSAGHPLYVAIVAQHGQPV